MIGLIDTHCHIQSIGQAGGEQTTSGLWSKLATEDMAQVIQRALDQKVDRLIAVGCDFNDSQLAIQAAAKFNNVWAAIGIHPHEAKHYALNLKKQQTFSKLLAQDRVVAIGECGLDYYYAYSDKASQIKILEFQLELAAQQNLPVIFHVREAFSDFWPILDNFKNISGVLHSYTDDLKNLAKALDRGLCLGVNGIATFTKSAEQITMYKAIPLSNLVLETDSPFLTPVPLRGSINEPKNVRLVAEYLANLRHLSLEVLADQTTKNAQKLFGI